MNAVVSNVVDLKRQRERKLLLKSGIPLLHQRDVREIVKLIARDVIRCRWSTGVEECEGIGLGRGEWRRESRRQREDRRGNGGRYRGEVCYGVESRIGDLSTKILKDRTVEGPKAARTTVLLVTLQESPIHGAKSTLPVLMLSEGDALACPGAEVRSRPVLSSTRL